MTRWRQLARELDAAAVREKSTRTPVQLAHLAQIGPPSDADLHLTALTALSAQGYTAETADPAPQLKIYRDRLESLVADGVMGRNAQEMAIGEVSADHDYLARRQVAYWHARLQASTVPSDAQLSRLRAGCIALAGETWLMTAARLGWSDRDLFGVLPAAPFVRHEAWGLTVWLLWSPHNRTDAAGNGHRVSIVEITADCAGVRTPTGATFRRDRQTQWSDFAGPLWTLAEFAPRARG